MSLVLQGVTITIEDQPLFAALDLEVRAGETVAVMAPSGAGKSSLLLAIAGGLRPPLRSRGRIYLDDRQLDGLPPERRNLGVLFQDPLLFPHLTVWENLAFALPRGLARRERRRRIEAALERAGLAGLDDRRPGTLSGGQAARVALVRALLAEPRALLLDEPFAKLDAPLRRQLRAFVREVIQGAALPALMVTHDLEDALGLDATITRLATPQSPSAADQATPRSIASARRPSSMPG